MARWKLNAPHYLKVPGIEWEQNQTSQQTGKTIRHRYEVPQLLNPGDPGDHNYLTPEGGEIIVCHEGLGLPRDYVFVGNPTPDMEPLDKEAEAISASLAGAWKHPIETLPSQGGFGEVLFKDLQKQLEAAIRGAAASVAVPAATQSLQGVSQEDFATLQKQVQQLLEQNMALQAKLIGAEPVEPIEDLVDLPAKAPPVSTERRV